MVKLGLYDPGFEEEIAFYTFDEIYSWGASDLQTFEFREHFCFCFFFSSFFYIYNSWRYLHEIYSWGLTSKLLNSVSIFVSVSLD